MASFLDKIKIRTAKGRNNKFDLSCQHITTQDFFSLRPVYFRELMPGTNIRIDQSSFVRLAPMFKPMFGSVRMINRAFFVPYRVVWDAFNDFLVDANYYHNGVTIHPTAAPYVNTSNLLRLMVEDSRFCSAGTAASYDFVYRSAQTTTNEFYRYTARGRQLVTILHSLGYNWCTDESSTYHMNVSILPLLSFMKIIADWYVNPQYTARRDAINSFISSCWQGGAIDERPLLECLTNVLYSLYDQDYFTSAFDNPLVPNDGTTSSVQIPEIKDYSKSINYPESGTAYSQRSIAGDAHVIYDSNDSQTPPPYIEGKAGLSNTNANAQSQYTYRGFVTMLNQYMLDSLKSLTTLIKRYQLVGSATLDRMMAEYGIELSAEKLKRCIYLGKNENNIDVSDVMATADTENSTGDSLGVVGDYAGKGIGAVGGSPFTYTTDEFGVVIVLSTIVPRASYCQGIMRSNLHIDRFDFFHGDFDALGTQAIATGELFNDMHTTSQFTSVTSWTPNKIFGYSPRYSEYATAQDFLSGDFRIRSLGSMQDLRAWHMFRVFNPTDEDEWTEIEKHSEDFSVGNAADYSYIFNYSPTGDDGCDHFFCSHVFNVTAHAPKKPLFDQFDFDNEGVDTVMHLGGTNLN